ncbi:MAG: gamma-glutamyl-phosphate reductase, partial [Tetragenococcus halophilus]|nr:gamma-glutamyl-phosphate reductase [Tetragenococcus halophilus]MDN6508122.1 gamma-glutamyl-phosphate reductase [Tetragenococcus halophilus]MDN6727760.1 gamma-glutamyl-phosphate reductase [Tetragenococcus halophilus]
MILTDLQTLGQQAKEAATELALLNTKEKNQLLENMACAIENNTEEILQANQKDLEQADENGIKEVMKDRLRLSEERIEAMAAGIR